MQVVHPLVSRRHAMLRVTARGVTLEDLGSSNGTWLNGVQCRRAMPIAAGDEFSLGRDGAKFKVIGATHRGEDLFADDDQKTLVAGDPRALRVAARIAVSPDALPSPPEAPEDEEEEPPTRAVRPGEFRGPPRRPPPPSTDAGDRTRSAKPGEMRGDSLIPVVQDFVSDSEFHDLMDDQDEPATVPVGRPDGGAAKPPPPPPRRPPEPEPRTERAAPPPRPRSTPKTEPVNLPPANTFEPAETQALAADDEPLEVRTRGFGPGVVVGLLLALIGLAAAAVFSPLPETLADLGLQRIDAGEPR